MIAWRVFCAIIEPANDTACSQWRHGPRESWLAGAACVVDRSNVRVALSVSDLTRLTVARFLDFSRRRARYTSHPHVRLLSYRRRRRRRWPPSTLLINCCGLSCRERPSPLVRSLHNFLVPSPRVSRGECECDRTSSMSYAFAISSGEVYNCFPNQHSQASKPHFVAFLLQRFDGFSFLLFLFSDVFAIF